MSTVPFVTAVSFDYTKKGEAATNRQGILVDDDKTGDSILVLEVLNGDITPLKPYLDYQRKRNELLAQIEVLDADQRADKSLPWKRFKNSNIAGRSDVKYPL